VVDEQVGREYGSPSTATGTSRAGCWTGWLSLDAGVARLSHQGWLPASRTRSSVGPMNDVPRVRAAGALAPVLLAAVLSAARCDPAVAPVATPTPTRGPAPALLLVEVHGAGPLGGVSSVVAATLTRKPLHLRSEAPAAVAGQPSAVLLADGLTPGTYAVDVTQELCGQDCGTGDTRIVFSVLCREELTLLPGQAVRLTVSVAPGTAAAQCSVRAFEQS
jgi:hypothetical protein